jgi:hypothetical protein
MLQENLKTFSNLGNRKICRGTTIGTFGPTTLPIPSSLMFSATRQTKENYGLAKTMVLVFLTLYRRLCLKQKTKGGHFSSTNSPTRNSMT